MARRSTAALKRIDAICRGTLQARDWINQPANEKTPDQLARRMAQAARRHGVKATILTRKTAGVEDGGHPCRRRRQRPSPRLLILDYHPPKARGTIALVGKGVTFDAGGLNLKPTGSIELMKIDMAGAAAVAASVIATAEIGAKQRIVGVIPLWKTWYPGMLSAPATSSKPTTVARSKSATPMPKDA
jgi:leucyl aminopeptidase